MHIEIIGIKNYESKKQKLILPHIGLRIIKSAVAVLCCCLFGLLVLLVDINIITGREYAGLIYAILVSACIVFLAGMDETLLSGKEQLSPYSQVEINRMLEDGANFTVSTGRTPGSLVEPLKNINIKLPVIAMNGAVLYDIRKNEYILSYIIPNHIAERICTILDGFDINYFINMLLENALLIQYRELKNVSSLQRG